MSEPGGRKRQRGRFWWIDRWRKSTAFIELTLAQQGAYHNLLDEQRLRGGMIPNEDRLLSRACGDPLEWPDMKDKLMRWFKVTPDGKHIYNVTANEVNDASDAISDAAAVGGKAKAAADRLRKEQRIGSGTAAEVATVDVLPLSVVRSLLSVSVSGTGTAHVERAPCVHPCVQGRLRPGKTVVCADCGEEFVGPANVNGNGVPEDQRQAYADAVWESFLAKTGERVTRLMSPGEFVVLKGWMDSGVPLRIIRRAIEDTRGKGSSLGYFGQSVKAAIESWRQAVPL